MSARNGWIIKGVKCNYFYNDNKNNRIPKDRDFEDNEFEKLYSTIPTIEYIFKNGMSWFDPVLMNYVAYNLNLTHPEFGVELLSFDKRAHYPKSTFSIASKDISEKVLTLISKGYEEALLQAQERINFLEDLVKELSTQPRQQITGTINAPIILADHKSNVKVTYFQLKESLEEITNHVKKSTNKSFLNMSKNNILDILKGAIGSIAANNLPEIVKSLDTILNIQPCFGPDISIEITKQFNFIRQYLKDIGYLK